LAMFEAPAPAPVDPRGQRIAELEQTVRTLEGENRRLRALVTFPRHYAPA
jgi:hypothetical protein